MDRKISILEDVSKEIINLFEKKNENIKNQFFSFYFDEDENTKEKQYENFDDISTDIFQHINQNLLQHFEFNKEIIKKYIIVIKKIKQEDIDILNLIIKSISLNRDILHYKLLDKNKFENTNDFENFIIENIHYNLNDYNNILSKYYNIRNIKDKILNIYVLIYNYSIYYSIDALKRNVYIKEN